MATNWSFAAVAKSRPYVTNLAAALLQAHMRLSAALTANPRGKSFPERMSIEDERSAAQQNYDDTRAELESLGITLGADDGSVLYFPFQLDSEPAWWVINPGKSWQAWEWPSQWRYQSDDDPIIRKVDSHTVQHSIYQVSR